MNILSIVIRGLEFVRFYIDENLSRLASSGTKCFSGDQFCNGKTIVWMEIVLVLKWKRENGCGLKSNQLINEPVNHFKGTTQGGAAAHLWEMSICPLVPETKD